MSNETTSEGVAGVGMFVAVFVDELAAEGALDGMKAAKKSGEFYYDHAAVIRCDAKGKVHIKETGDMTTGKGAGIGAVIGGVVGLLGGPAGVALGAGAGAAIGAIAAHGDAGFDNDSLKEIGAALTPGSSAVAATTSQAFVEEVRKQAQQGENVAAAQDFAKVIRENLELRQDALYSLVITEEGIAASQVVSSPTAVAVFGIAATEEGVVAGAAAATPDAAGYKVVAATEEGAVGEAGVVTDEGAVVVDAAAVPVDEEGEEEEAEEEAEE